MTSDLPIPPVAAIQDRARECQASAERLGDTAAYAQLDRLITRVPDARLCWQLGTLHIVSPSGGRYHVSRAGCDCLNAQRCGKRQCWHWALHGLLLDMFQTDCDTADMAAEAPSLAPRIVAARRTCWARL